MEAGSLSEKEFRVVIRKMIQELGRGIIDYKSKKFRVFNKKLENKKATEQR